MSDIVRLEDYLRRQTAEASHEEADDNAMFLLTEGLDILAAYRAIEDIEIRLSIKRLIEAMAKQQT